MPRQSGKEELSIQKQKMLEKTNKGNRSQVLLL